MPELVCAGDVRVCGEFRGSCVWSAHSGLYIRHTHTTQTMYFLVRFQVIASTNMKMAVFWDAIV
jgi:hypothetical protein